MRTRFRGSAAALVPAVILVALWMAIAPSGLGGSCSYSVTEGISMQPMIHKGDLALVRSVPTYKVGDVVLYDNQLLRKPVLHRIVVIQNGEYFFRGDNNDFVDPGYATRSELVGKLWVHVDKLGATVGWLGVPTHAALLAGATGAVLVLAGGKRAGRRRRRGQDAWRVQSEALRTGGP